MREAKPHLEALVNRFLKMPTEMLLPPGYTNIESMKRIRAAKVTGKPSDASRTWCGPASSSIGSPNTVREKLAEYQDLAGFNTSLTKTQFGTLPDDMTRANMRRSPRRSCRTSAIACRRASGRPRRNSCRRVTAKR